MIIYEIRIIVGGSPVVSSNYYSPNEKDIDQIQKCALLSYILDFVSILISPMEYFESDKYSVVFDKTIIRTIDLDKMDVYSYTILNKKRAQRIV